MGSVISLQGSNPEVLMSALGHVWTAPPWQELSELLQHWSGAVMCPACLCGREAAGHNALHGSGPNQKHAFQRCVDPHGLSRSPDRPCLHYLVCPRQFLQLQTPPSLPVSPP